MQKIIFLLSALSILSCASQKTTETPVKPADKILKQDIPVMKDTTVLKNDTTTILTKPGDATTNIPACIQKMIADFTKDPKQNPPRKIIQYSYKGQVVYYVPPICCDQYSNLYDDDCRLLGHPDGGFTGRGDGKFTGFSKEAGNEKLIWEDKRK